MRRTHEVAFKAKVVQQAVKGEKTIGQIASDYGVHPNQIRQWRAWLLELLPALFSQRRPQRENVDTGANSEDVFSGIPRKMAFGHEKC